MSLSLVMSFDLKSVLPHISVATNLVTICMEYDFPISSKCVGDSNTWIMCFYSLCQSLLIDWITDRRDQLPHCAVFYMPYSFFVLHFLHSYHFLCLDFFVVKCLNSFPLLLCIFCCSFLCGYHGICIWHPEVLRL